MSNQSISNKRLKAFIIPFLTIRKHKIDFFLWFLFVIFAGQLGTIINLISRVLFGEWDVSHSLYADSIFGNFYTYALVLMASILGPIFIRLIHKNNGKPEFRTIVILFTSILVFLIFFTGIFFSFATQDCAKEYQNTEGIKIDIKQLIFFVVSILVSIYSFGIERMSEHEENIQYDDDHLEKENGNIQVMIEKSEKVTEDKEIDL